MQFVVNLPSIFAHKFLPIGFATRLPTIQQVQFSALNPRRQKVKYINCVCYYSFMLVGASIMFAFNLLLICT